MFFYPWVQVKYSCKYSEARARGRLSSGSPSRTRGAGFTARQGASELIIKTFSKKDLMFKGAAPEKR